MLEKILSLPLDDNKYYALRAGHEPIVNGETNFEALVYSFEDRLVLFGFAYAPFILRLVNDYMSIKTSINMKWTFIVFMKLHKKKP